MTTIACNREMMACDSLYCDENLKGKTKRKIARINGDLIGFAGSMGEGLAFIEWYKDQSKEKPEISDTTMLVLKSDGTILTYDAHYHPVILEDYDFYSVGSGCNFAMGAMMAGKSPKEAVNIAAKLDSGSAPPIRVLYI